MSMYDDIKQGLLEAIEIEKGNIPLVKRNGVPAPTFYARQRENELIDEIVTIRKREKISQKRIAAMTGSNQQTISRFEKKEHSPSLKMFYSICNALGYDITLVKKA